MIRDIEKTIRDLHSNVDYNVRIRAVRAISRVPEKAAVQALVQALTDLDTDVVRAVIHALRKKNVRDAVPQLLKPRFLNSQDPNVRWALAMALEALGGSETLEPLITLLDDENWNVRNAAGEALFRRIGDLAAEDSREAVKMLLRILIIPNAALHRKVVDTLSSMQSFSDDIIRETLDSPSAQVRRAIIEIIGLTGNRRFTPMLVPRLEDESKAMRRQIIEAFLRLKDERAIEPLISRLDDGDRGVAALAVKALVGTGRACTPHLLSIVRHPLSKGKRLRVNAILCLGELRDPAAVLDILNNLGSSYFEIRQAAVKALISIRTGVLEYLPDVLAGSQVSIEPMARALKQCPTRRIRLRYIRALGELKEPGAVPVLRGIIQQGLAPESQIAYEAEENIYGAIWARASALSVIGEIGGEKDLDMVLHTLRDHSPEVKLEAVRTLDRMRRRLNLEITARIVNALLPMAKEPDELIRAVGLSVLGHAEDHRDRAVRTLSAALRDASYEVRSRACQALGQLHAREASRALIRALGDPSWTVRRDAEFALGNIGSQNKKLLIAALDSKNEYIVIRAAKLLAGFKCRDVLDKLVRIMKRNRKEANINKFMPGIIRTLKSS
jgi:HEAT repeat protein